MIEVLVADDQAMVRDGFAAILGVEDDISVVGEAADGVEAVERDDDDRVTSAGVAQHRVQPGAGPVGRFGHPVGEHPPGVDALGAHLVPRLLQSLVAHAPDRRRLR